VTTLAAYFLLISWISASDFSFTAGDLIAKESYRKISMDFKDASLKNILKIFSEQAGLNFIASQYVQDRTLTLYLDNVPLQEALNKIMSANNLKYELQAGEGVFVVKESGKPEIDLITKIYQLKYARLKGSKLETAITAGATGSSSGTGDAAAASSAAGSGASASNIEDAVKGVLSANGRLVQDTRTNSLIVTDITDQFDIVEKVIAILDVASPQVMIEVEMLDVSKRTIDQMGVNTTPSLMQLTGSSTTTRFPNFMADGISSLAPQTFNYGTLSAAVFSAVLDYLSTDTKTRFLARPRILTMTNESAEIKITTQEAIGQNSITTSSEGTATTQIQAERFETGVSLKVTPQIDLQTGSITMFIQPTVSQAKTGATFGTTTYKDPEIRSSQTTLMVKNGETIVVGGLIRTNEETTIRKMPLIGDVPLIGALFRHKDKTSEERELIVFITPRIIGNADAIALARTDPASLPLVPLREQADGITRKEEIDNMLERWEN
jgi:type IV pilus assembly protein PilQ